MEWIKRNIVFVAGSIVAVLLMGLAGYYLMAGMGKNDQALEKLNAEYALLEQLNKQDPHPGDENTDNIAAARAQRRRVENFIRDASKVFQPVTPVLSGARVDEKMFADALSATILRLQRNAEGSGVQLPTNFYFSFTAVRDRIQFDRAALKPLAEQLSEVKAVCDVLIEARVNAIDGVRRPKISAHDAEAQQTTDYLAEATTTNEVALLTPYEVTFRCFSSELAAVLAGFASSPHGLIVRAMNVAPATAAGAKYGGTETPEGFLPNIPRAGYEAGPVPNNPYGAAATAYGAAPPTPPAVNPYGTAANPYGAAATAYGAAANPFGPNTGANPFGPNTGANPFGPNTGANPFGGAAPNPFQANANEPFGTTRATPYPTAPSPAYPTPPPTTVRTRPSAAARSALPTLLDERQLKVTMLVQVVKLKTANVASNR